MAQKPRKTQGVRAFNIIETLRGNFGFTSKEEPKTPITAYASPDLISREDRTKLLSGNLQSPANQQRPVQAGSLMAIVQGSMTKVGQERIENRKILELMPEVDKAARLMIASIFSPSDLAREVLPVVFHNASIKEEHKKRLEDYAQKFFQDKMDLKTEAPKWVYQYGYETGSSVFAIIPMASFDKIHNESYIGEESFRTNILDPISHESLFDFGDSASFHRNKEDDVVGLESFTNKVLIDQDQGRDADKKIFNNQISPGYAKGLLDKMLGQEALSLTDNPSVLRVQKYFKDKSEKKTKQTINARFKTPMAETMVSLSPEEETEVTGNPLMMRLPPESVTVIHTPGDPNDHQGYLVMLDQMGNPINAVAQEEARASSPHHYDNNQQSIFQQTGNAYGAPSSSSSRGLLDHDAMGRVYTQIVTEHLKKRLGKAGFNHVDMDRMDSIYRCMFSRFLQQKQTRILFLPKELVTYMTFEMDDHGNGVSRLDGIKFTLGMKMALQVSRVLAAIKGAMDKRKIDVKFDANFMEQPEAVFNSVINEYIKKQNITFSIDPSSIQRQIADKSISIKGSGIPGMEEFDITNEPDTRAGAIEVDSDMMTQLDKTILNGLRVPASTMNSLSEDEFARSVTTTNLFFAMDVSIDQEITIKLLSDLLRKYARFSEEFQKGLLDIFPQLGKKGIKNKTSTDESTADKDEEESSGLPDNYTLEMLISEMYISLPKPNVAPGKAQFEALEAMVTAITATVTALLPDELVGSDETLRPALAVLRAKEIVSNIRNYLKTSGMSNLTVPENDIAGSLGAVKTLHDGLYSLAELMKDNAAIGRVEEPVAPPTTEGY